MSGGRRRGPDAEFPRVVLDTGALIGLDQRHPSERLRDLVATAAASGRRFRIPAVVVAEWWRGDNLAHHRNAKIFSLFVEGGGSVIGPPTREPGAALALGTPDTIPSCEGRDGRSG